MVGRLIFLYLQKKNRKGILEIGKNSYIRGLAKCLDKKYMIIGSNSHILDGARIQNVSQNESVRIRIGNHTGAQYNFTVLAGANVTIGNGVAIASDVFISAGSHGMNPEIRLPYGEQAYLGEDVLIKDGAWIGEKACILSGVTIGYKSIVGSGSVVTKDVPDYCIVAGVPMRIIGKIDERGNKVDL